ncbi:hypothetical protein QQP08_001480 [Theobroma cacao]|nr:hypothetical protein QQP08_001480 [Theobroma cacao]
MATGNPSFPLKCFFLGLLCFVILLIKPNITGVVALAKEWEIVMRPCSQVKDSNIYCLTNGFPLGGYCKTLNPSAPSFCLCKYT